MSDPVVVVGSGASGVHFACTMLEHGREVVMLDVGRRRPAPLRPQDDFVALKSSLEDPVRYFLGEDFESLVLPGHAGEYYGFPPSKGYVFEGVDGIEHRASGFEPLLSFAAGGLAEAWTGGCYPLTERELAEFPFGWHELAPYYDRIGRRIGITGVEDDLAPFFPRHDGMLAPLDLDRHSVALLERYQRCRGRLNADHRCFLGRARLAVLSRDRGDREACSYLGRCLWGCPTDALYTPSVTLRTCMGHRGFTYQDRVVVSHFVFGDDGRVTSVVGRELDGGGEREQKVGTLVLAAGTLCTSKIVLDSIYRASGEVVELPGLTDNRQVMMPFVNTAMLGQSYDPKSYQYHQLAFALDADDPHDYVHGLVTTLTTAMVHPIVQSIPASVGTSLAMFRRMHAALGLININFTDRRREENGLGLDVSGRGRPTRLAIRYRPAPEEPARLARATRTFRAVLRRLGCVAPRGMTHVRPMGASVHYSGTLPMSREGGRFTTDENGRSRDFENLYVIDGSTFPTLPAKNLTFTLMANAARIAAQLARR